MQNLRILVPQKMHQPDNRRNQKPWKSKLDLYWMLRAPMSSPSVPWESWPHLVEWPRQYTNRGWGQRWRETWRDSLAAFCWHLTMFHWRQQSRQFWTNLNYSSHQKLNKIYEEIVRWKPIFFNIFRNKTGELFLKCMETTLQPLAENTNHHEMSKKAAMVLPHQILARATDHGDGSVNKLLQIRLQLWINGDFDKLFEESHALQKRIRTKRKLLFDEKKEFKRQMTSGKVANAIRTLQNE